MKYGVIAFQRWTRVFTDSIIVESPAGLESTRTDRENSLYLVF